MNALTAAHRWHAAKPRDWWCDRPHIDGVFILNADGKRWAIATDGMIAVMEETDAPGEPWPLDPDKGRAAMFPDFGEPVCALPVADLRAFASEPAPPPTEMVPCPDCRGKGKELHDCDCDYCYRNHEDEDCEECDGTGRVLADPPLRQGWIGDCLFNLDFLAGAFAVLPDGYAASLSVAPLKIRVDCGPVGLLVMGRNQDLCDLTGDEPRLSLVGGAS